MKGRSQNLRKRAKKSGLIITQTTGPSKEILMVRDAVLWLIFTTGILLGMGMAGLLQWSDKILGGVS